MINKRIAIFISALLVLPIILLGFLTHDIPNNDYWGHFFIPFLENGQVLNLDVLFNTSNEHYIVFPNILYYINILLTGGSNIGLYSINILLNLGIVYFLFNIVKILWSKDKQLRYLFLIVITFFVFAPISTHNWMQSMSGIAWFSANFFMAVSLYLFFRLKIQESNWKMFLLLLLSSILAFFSYSTGIFVFGSISILFVGYHLIKRTWQGYKYSVIYLITTALFYIWWLFFLYEKPGHHPDIERSITGIIKYVMIFLSSLMSENSYEVAVLSLISFVVIFVSSLYIVFEIRKNRAEWYHLFPLGIITFTLVNALASALARAGFGIQMATAARYVNVSLLYWLGVVLILLVAISLLFKNYLKFNVKQHSVSMALVTILLGVSISLPLYVIGVTKYIYLQDRIGFDMGRLYQLSYETGFHDEHLEIVFFNNLDVDYITSLDGHQNFQPFNTDIFPNELLISDVISDNSLETVSLDIKLERLTGEDRGIYRSVFDFVPHSEAISIQNEDGGIVGVFLPTSFIYEGEILKDYSSDEYRGYIDLDSIGASEIIFIRSKQSDNSIKDYVAEITIIPLE